MMIRYYAFEDWADTPAGKWHLHKRDRRTGQWIPMPRRSEAGRFVVPRDAKGAFKTCLLYTSDAADE